MRSGRDENFGRFYLVDFRLAFFDDRTADFFAAFPAFFAAGFFAAFRAGRAADFFAAFVLVFALLTACFAGVLPAILSLQLMYG